MIFPYEGFFAIVLVKKNVVDEEKPMSFLLSTFVFHTLNCFPGLNQCIKCWPGPRCTDDSGHDRSSGALFFALDGVGGGAQKIPRIAGPFRVGCTLECLQEDRGLKLSRKTAKEACQLVPLLL